MITLEEAKAALKNYGLKIDDKTLECYVEIVNETSQCLIDAGLSDCKVHVVLINALLLQVWFAGPAKISSTSGASGSSVSFKFDDDQYKKLTSQINQLDKDGCTASIIPPDPSKDSAYFDVVCGL